MRTLLLATFMVISGTGLSQGDTTGVRQMIEAYDIKHPDIVMRQLCMESGYLSCDTLCSWSCCNNPFGFLWKGSYLEYDNLEHAIEYYKWWQDQLYRGGDYYLFLERVGYSTSPSYTDALKKMW